MKGKLVVFEGVDGSGKETQAARLFKRLENDKINVLMVKFPNYESDSSALVKMYLNGWFGSNPDDVNPYAASMFYAVDRYASFKLGWESFYSSGGIVIADRYTTSNMIHQAAKIADSGLKDRYLEWLCDMEFNKLELPVPDCVIFIDMPPEYGLRLIEGRNNKFTGEEKKDIHEKDREYIIKSYGNACMIAEKYGWCRIECVSEGKIKTVDEIHEKIYAEIKLHCL